MIELQLVLGICLGLKLRGFKNVSVTHEHTRDRSGVTNLETDAI